MSNWFTGYSRGETGRALARIIGRPDRMLEFRLLSKLGKPAVQAIASDVSTIIERLPTKAERDAASQFCGWYVAQLMRRAGYEIAQDRGRVSDAPFKTGAVWRRERPVQIVHGPVPPPLDEQGRVELGVARNEAGEVIGRWRIDSTRSGLVDHFYTITALDEPIEVSFREAYDWAERYGFSTLWINDPDGLFSPEHRQHIST
jgi:hypothetical protein